ncbi:hypothetical protein BDN67DRAFT_972862 [Paxillus ammoniavirescens]|nr:hypothetical protein BDN67DRAFT_972862 [Paxillus ammoniavirescens]
MDDVCPRPHKRQRTDHLTDSTEPSDSLLLSSSTSVPTESSPPSLRPLPPQVLLLALPALLAHPPTHENYPLSLFLSLKALRICLELKALTADVECRAWTGLAEVGLRAIESGFSTSGEHEWANGLEAEVEKAIGKGLLIAQKHPSLRPLRHHLSLLNSHFAFQSNNTKFARALLRRLIASFMPSDPPSIVYMAHLALITQLTSTPPQPTTTTTSPTSGDKTSVLELQAALTAITTLSTLAAQNRHSAIEDLAAVLRVRVLVSAGMWDLVGEALEAAEKALCLVFRDAENEGPAKGQESNKVKQEPPEALMRSYSITAQDVHDSAASQSQSQANVSVPHPDTVPRPSSPEAAPSIPGPKATDSLILSLTAHILILGTVYHTHAGRARSAELRLAALHTLMDGGPLVGGANSDGLVEVPIPGYGSIHLRTTHPRILFLLTFLVSAIAKRDPVGRRPKKRVFAEYGVTQCREGREGDEGPVGINVPLWASQGDVDMIDDRALRIEADLLCELVAVSIQRSEFDAAENHLATLIAHTRTHDIFDAYAARIALHHAHLAHALGDTERAGTCYRVAADLDGACPVGSSVMSGGGFIAAAARAGEALLRIGLTALYSPPPSSIPPADPRLDADTVALAKDAIARCSASSSAPLPALGALISAALSRTHIIRSKALLKHALSLLSAAGDNHLRALVLAVVGAQYVYTAPAHAMEVLAVCETLGAGMGANAKREKEGESAVARTSEDSGGKNAIGNAPLRLWVGERFLELFKRSGKDKRARKQEAFNAVYQSAVDNLGTPRTRLW